MVVENCWELVRRHIPIRLKSLTPQNVDLPTVAVMTVFPASVVISSDALYVVLYASVGSYGCCSLTSVKVH